METEPVLQAKVSEESGLVRRTRSSWLDRLIAEIKRLPGPSWLFYGALLIVLMIVNNALQWRDGTLPVGTFDQARTTDVLFPIYFLALIHYLNWWAGRALENFRPVTDLTDAEYAGLAHELQSIPARPALIAGVVGAAFIVGSLLTDPASYGIFPKSSLITTLFISTLAVFWGAMLFVFILHAVRQLNLVNHIYRRATRIELFHLKPVYAFSALTARTGIGLIFFVYFVLAINGDNSVPASNAVTFKLSTNFTIGGDILGLLFIGALLLTGIAAFILPLQGIHQRLVEEKRHKGAEVASRLRIAVETLHQNVDSNNFDHMPGIFNGFSALKLERDELNKISTWPWETVTLNGFMTAILIPVLLWLVTRLLERFI